MKAFQRFALFNLVFSLLVIVWGAYVRASGSGAGCGQHWPLCNGEVLPTPERIQTVVEFVHRASSGLSLIFVVVALFWSYRLADKNSLVRRAAGLSVVAIFLEAILGAGLVLLKLVEFDQSVKRAISISLHSANTLFLVASLASLVWLSKREEAFRGEKNPTVFPVKPYFKFTLFAFIALAMCGAITALGDTLFPAISLKAGWEADLAVSAHFLLRLRIIHPLLAVVWIGLVFGWTQKLEGAGLHSARNYLLVAVVSQFVLGILNWMLMAPNALQMLHLLIADLVFISFWISGLEYEARKSSHTA